MAQELPPPEELLDLVNDKESFIAFVRALAQERREAQKIEALNPRSYQLEGAKGWMNGDIQNFLEAALEYFKSPYRRPEAVPSWQMMASFLYCGKIIE